MLCDSSMASQPIRRIALGPVPVAVQPHPAWANYRKLIVSLVPGVLSQVGAPGAPNMEIHREPVVALAFHGSQGTVASLA